jgi:mannose-1-phosphate guanylyltransferase
LREHLPKTAPILGEIAKAYGTKKFDPTFKKLYPKCENISVDYAVLEPRSAKGEGKSHLYCIPSDFGWNDLGSWAALFDHHSAKKSHADNNVIHGRDFFTLNAQGNYVHSPKKFVATIGVNNLVIVETEDALLITTREKAQDVGKVVKYLDEKKLVKLT